MVSDLLIPLEQRSYFFDDGLCFECTQCGACCVGDAGTIYVSAEETTAVAAHLEISRNRFINDYLYPYKDSYSIREDADSRCLFFDQGCRIYSVRPLQCRTFPFWFSNLRSENRWYRIAAQCPGVGQGRRYSRHDILQIARTTMHI